MIGYLYYHTGEEYVSKFSLARDDARFGDTSRLFTALRTFVRGDGATFTYAVGGGDFLMLQTSSSRESGLTARGLRGACTEAARPPVCYAGRFPSKPSAAELSAAVLPDASLPLPPREGGISSVVQDLHHIFPKLFDALLRGQKPVILIAETPERAAQYFTAIGMLLPLSFMRRVGFCMGSAGIADGPVTVTRNDGVQETFSVQVWMPDMPSFRFESYAEEYHVFDTRVPRDNYTQPLSLAARVLEETDLGDETAARRFAAGIAAAFSPDGSFDEGELGRRAAVYAFEMRGGRENARAVLDFGTAGDGQADAFVRAAALLLREASAEAPLPEEDAARIMQQFNASPDVRARLGEEMFGYFLRRRAFLGKAEEVCFSELLTEDDTGARLELLLQDEGAAAEREKTFRLAAGALDARLKTARTVEANAAWVGALIAFTDVRNTFTDSAQDRAFFAALNGLSPRAQELLCAVLAASAYAAGVEALCELRVGLVRTFLQPRPAEAVIPFLLNARKDLVTIAALLPETGVPPAAELVTDTERGRAWLREKLRTTSLAALLEAEGEVRAHNARCAAYTGLRDVLLGRLLDIGWLKGVLRSDSPERPAYCDFFYGLRGEEREAHPEIMALLTELGHAADVSREFAEYRCRFAKECFDTMRDSDRRKVLTGGMSEFPDFSKGQYPPEMRLTVVENTISAFGTVKGESWVLRRAVSAIGIWAFFMALLSLVVLCLPPVVISLALGAQDAAAMAERLFGYFIPALVLVPLAVYLLDLLAYVCLRKGRRVRRANLITLLCGIAPTVCFAAAYIVCYFVALPLPFVA